MRRSRDVVYNRGGKLRRARVYETVCDGCRVATPVSYPSNGWIRLVLHGTTIVRDYCPQCASDLAEHGYCPVLVEKGTARPD